MRRLRDRASVRFFRGTELPRLLTMIVMLGVLVLLIDLVRKPSTWSWLAPDVGQEKQAAGADDAQAASDVDLGVVAPDPGTTGPTDADALEWDGAREEFQAITDRTPLGPEEMPAYWRLMAWEQHQSTEELLKRAEKNVTYNDLWQRPAKWRGKLLELRVHLRQAIELDDLPENPLDFETLYEVTGWTSDAWNWYWMITPQLPPGMPGGKDVYEEATFIGYFLKLQPYEDRQGRARAMPVLIGRLIWHPAAATPFARSDEWTWPWYLAGALVVLFVVRWALALSGRARRAASSAVVSRSDPHEVEAWLDGASNSADNGGFDPHDAEVRTGDATPWEMAGPPPPVE